MGREMLVSTDACKAWQASYHLARRALFGNLVKASILTRAR